MQRPIIAAFAVLVMGCGCGAAESRTNPPPTEPPPAEPQPVEGDLVDTVEPEQESQLTDAQRAVLAPELLRYGSGWTLSKIEESFTVAATDIPNGYELLFVARGHSGLFSQPQIEIGGSFRGGGLNLPQGPELTPEQLEVAGAVLREAGELWLLGSNGECQHLDLSEGLASIAGDGAMETRAHNGRAVLLTEQDGDHDALVFVIDLNDRTILEGGGRSMPPSGDTDMLSSEEFDFIDRALRTHGSFGVYGDVTQGLRALMSNQRVQIMREDGGYSVSVVPPNRHRHELQFLIDGRTGEISGMVAAHSIPAPH